MCLLMLHLFAMYSSGYFDVTYDSEISISRFTSAVIELLIVIPFIASRVVRYIQPLLTMIQDYQKYISHISIFIILFYLFGLQNSQLLVEAYDFEPELFFIALIAVVVFYLLVLVVSKWIYDLNSPQDRAAFWHSITIDHVLYSDDFQLNNVEVVSPFAGDHRPILSRLKIKR